MKAIDLFCGIGGFHYAAKANGIDVVFASEIDKYAVSEYEANHVLRPHGDITKIEAADIPPHDLLMGDLYPALQSSSSEFIAVPGGSLSLSQTEKGSPIRRERFAIFKDLQRQWPILHHRRQWRRLRRKNRFIFSGR